MVNPFSLLNYLKQLSCLIDNAIFSYFLKDMLYCSVIALRHRKYDLYSLNIILNFNGKFGKRTDLFETNFDLTDIILI